MRSLAGFVQIDRDGNLLRAAWWNCQQKALGCTDWSFGLQGVKSPRRPCHEAQDEEQVQIRALRASGQVLCYVGRGNTSDHLE
jgi:hypothetical protein